MSSLLPVLHVVCTVVGALVLYTLITGAVASAVLRRLNRGGPALPASAGAGSPRPGWAEVTPEGDDARGSFVGVSA